MVVRIKIALEQEEYSALLKLGLSKLRNPEEQLRFILIRHLRRLGILPVQDGESGAVKTRNSYCSKKVNR